MSRAWVYLLVAVFFEIIYAVSLKESQGYTRFWPTVINILSLISDIFFLAIAFKTLPMSSAYAVWTGLGAVGVVMYGLWIYGEPCTPARVAFISMIILGVIGLRVSAGE